MAPRFRSDVVRVRTPATSANLGPGFDCLGLALRLHDALSAQVVDTGLRIEVSGEGVGVPRDATHLVVRAMHTTFDRLGGRPSGLRLACENAIPHGRGLGSSAAAIVAGVRLARSLTVDGAALLPDADAFALACEIEGHPDNVAACFLGGLTLAWTEAGRARAVRIDVRSDVRPVVLVPPYESSTAAARALMPATVPLGDATHSAARTALLVRALGDPAVALDLLLAATEDRLHQPYRAAAAPETAELVRSLRGRGHAAVVSGAGPTVLVLARDEVEVSTVLATSPTGWTALSPAVDPTGAADG